MSTIRRRGTVSAWVTVQERKGSRSRIGEYSSDSECAEETNAEKKNGRDQQERKRQHHEEETSENGDGQSAYKMVVKLLEQHSDHDVDGRPDHGIKKVRYDEQPPTNIQVEPGTNEDNESVCSGAWRPRFNECLTRNLRRVGLKRRIVHDIFESPADGCRGRFRRGIIQNLQLSSDRVRKGGRGTARGIFILAEHGTHLHVIHDCAYANNTCRCSAINILRDYPSGFDQKSTQDSEKITAREQELEEGTNELEKETTGIGSRIREVRERGRTSTSQKEGELPQSEYRGEQQLGRGGTVPGLQLLARRYCSSALLDDGYFQNTATYLCTGSRRIHYFEVAGDIWQVGNEIRYLPLQELCEKSKSGLVEISRDACNDGDLWKGLSCRHIDGKDEEGSTETNDEHQRNRSGPKTSRLEAWLEGFIITPTQNIIYTGHWVNGPFKYQNRSDSFFKNCLHNINQKLCDFTYKQLFLKTRNISMNRLIYVAPWNSISTYYFNIEHSVKVLESLLYFQMDNDPERVYSFLQHLYWVVCKSVPKRNTFMVTSPPNAGKNYFFDCLIHSCINFGQIANFNKYNQFPLMDCVQKRILLWNEPNYEPGAEETLKTIFGGDSTAVRVKYQGDAIIPRTPLIILTNTDIFPRTAAFDARMFRYTWRSASYLKYIKKKPHPLAMFYLFLKYNLMSMSNVVLENWEKDLINTKYKF